VEPNISAVREVRSSDTSQRELLDDAEHRNVISVVTRYGKPVAIVVPPEWYADAVAALAGRGAS
jgi:hypothetical protein